MSAAEFPNGMDFLKQFWQNGAASAAASPAGFSPSASPAFSQAMGQYMMPTFDLDELDKRISDMRTVLHFMELNTQLLRQSLSTLEVQRGTLAALQSMGSPAATKTASPTNTSHAPDGTSPVAANAPWLDSWLSMVQTATQNSAAANQPASGAKPSASPAAEKSPKKPSPSAKKTTAAKPRTAAARTKK